MNIIKDADVLSVENLFKDKYIIPLYQRNFAWGEEQISRLLQDIYESMCSGDEHFMLEVLLFSKEVMENWKLLMGSRDLQCFQYFQAY